MKEGRLARLPSFISDDFGECIEKTIGEDRFSRLTVPPGIWFGF